MKLNVSLTSLQKLTQMDHRLKCKSFTKLVEKIGENLYNPGLG